MVRLTDRFDMSIVVDWDVKPQFKQRISASLCLKKNNNIDKEKKSYRYMLIDKEKKRFFNFPDL